MTSDLQWRKTDEEVEMEHVMSDTIGPWKMDIQYIQDVMPGWNGPTPWKPSKVSTLMALRWQHVVKEREHVGSTHYLRLVPEAEKEVDSRCLPYTQWMKKGQLLLVKVFALNNLRCPVFRCEPKDNQELS